MVALVISEETKLRYDVARYLHTMWCSCGKPMSEYPYTSSWLVPADALLEIIRKDNDIKPKAQTDEALVAETS